MEALQTSLKDFISECTNLTLAVSDGVQPYCANCFFAFLPEEAILVFKSKEETNHIRYAIGHPGVAGTILPDKLDKSRVRGVQFRGSFHEPEGIDKDRATEAYYGRFPFARAIGGKIWAIHLESIAFTDKVLGIGQKLQWERNSEVPST